jgi:hypothetical protein
MRKGTRETFHSARPKEMFEGAKVTNVPPSHQFPSTQSRQTPGMIRGTMSNLMQGIAFGAGSEVAHQAVKGISQSGTGHNDITPQPVPQTFNESCYQENQNFMICLQTNKYDISMCQSYFDLFKQCKGEGLN